MDYTYKSRIKGSSGDNHEKNAIVPTLRGFLVTPHAPSQFGFIVLTTNPDGSFGTKKYFRSKKFGRPTDSFGC